MIICSNLALGSRDKSADSLFYAYYFTQSSALFNSQALCERLRKTGLDGALQTGTWTVFAPTNQAFVSLPRGYLDFLDDDIPELFNTLLFHAVPNQTLEKDDLPCVAGQNLIVMANTKGTLRCCSVYTCPAVTSLYHVFAQYILLAVDVFFLSPKILEHCARTTYPFIKRVLVISTTTYQCFRNLIDQPVMAVRASENVKMNVMRKNLPICWSL
jgi:hypothetical protein